MPKIITGQLAPLPLDNVDTDIIMPKRFLKTITREGLADGTFADLRFDEGGAVLADFVLNKPNWKAATILVVGDNFGCGSSREHAVWGLVQLGIAAIIGTGFAGIFYDNARKNGLALAIVSNEDRDRLMKEASALEKVEATIDIASKNIKMKASGSSFEMPFEMNSATRAGLIENRDDTLDTLKFENKIREFENSFYVNGSVQVIQ